MSPNEYLIVFPQLSARDYPPNNYFYKYEHKVALTIDNKHLSFDQNSLSLHFAEIANAAVAMFQRKGAFFDNLFVSDDILKLIITSDKVKLVNH